MAGKASTAALHAMTTVIKEVARPIAEMFRLLAVAIGLRRKAGLDSGVATISEAGRETRDNAEAAANESGRSARVAVTRALAIRVQP